MTGSPDLPAAHGEGRSRTFYRPPWRIDFTVRPDVRSVVADGDLARIVARALDAAGAPSPASIGLILSDDSELTMLNRQHMGESGPTDVLSFPLLPAEAFPAHPGRAPLRTARAPAAFALPPSTRTHLGDIVVSVERAVAQAAGGAGGQTGDVRWSPADELRLLVAHGVLHVCGWDHADPDERRAMRGLEQRVVNERPRSTRPTRADLAPLRRDPSPGG